MPTSSASSGESDINRSSISISLLPNFYYLSEGRKRPVSNHLYLSQHIGASMMSPLPTPCFPASDSRQPDWVKPQEHSHSGYEYSPRSQASCQALETLSVVFWTEVRAGVDKLSDCPSGPQQQPWRPDRFVRRARITLQQWRTGASTVLTFPLPLKTAVSSPDIVCDSPEGVYAESCLYRPHQSPSDSQSATQRQPG